MTAVPLLFRDIPTTFFGPLTGRGAGLYWSVLARLYEAQFESGRTRLLRPYALELAEQSLRESPDWAAGPEGVLHLLTEDGLVPAEALATLSGEDAQLRAAARHVIRRLEDTRWIHFEFRREYGEVCNFYAHAARMLDTLMRLARDEQPVLQGYTYNILTMLGERTFAERPGVSLVTAKRSAVDFVRELKVLNQNIYQSIRRLLAEVMDAAGVLEESFDRYQRRVMANYHRLKTVENFFRVRDQILRLLGDVERQAPLLEDAAVWLAETDDLTLEAARARVAEDLALIRQLVEDLPDTLTDIDDRNARFSRVALRRLLYLLHQDKNVEGQLEFILQALKHERPPELELDCFRFEALRLDAMGQDDFLYVLPQLRPPAPPPQPPPPGPDREHAREHAARAVVGTHYTRQSIARWVKEQLTGRSVVRVRDLPLATDEDYVRLIYVTAYGLESDQPYLFRPATCREGQDPCDRPTCGACRLQVGPYTVPNGILQPASMRSRG